MVCPAAAIADRCCTTLRAERLSRPARVQGSRKGPRFRVQGKGPDLGKLGACSGYRAKAQAVQHSMADVRQPDR